LKWKIGGTPIYPRMQRKLFPEEKRKERFFPEEKRLRKLFPEEKKTKKKYFI
jgi:hypothetical protein